jgi:hypothetical protein
VHYRQIREHCELSSKPGRSTDIVLVRGDTACEERGARLWIQADGVGNEVTQVVVFSSPEHRSYLREMEKDAFRARLHSAT